MPGSGVPGTTTGLQVGVTNDTHFHLTWDAMRGAAGYYVLSRSISQSETRWEKVDGTFSRPCADVLAPTNGTYEYALNLLLIDDGGADLLKDMRLLRLMATPMVVEVKPWRRRKRDLRVLERVLLLLVSIESMQGVHWRTCADVKCQTRALLQTRQPFQAPIRSILVIRRR